MTIQKAFTVFCWISALIVLLGILFILIGDLFFFVRGGAGQTISYQIWVFSKQYPMFPFSMGLFIGILCGHLFWQYDPDNINPVQLKHVITWARGGGMPVRCMK